MPAAAAGWAAGQLLDENRLPQIVAGLLAALLALLLLLILLPIIIVIAFFSGPAASGDAPPGSGIPAIYVPIYKTAAEAFNVNWYLLASIHFQESGYSGTAQGVRSGVNAYGCCAGPTQFNVTNGPPSTWDGHKTAYLRIESQRPTQSCDDTGRCLQVHAPHPSVYDDFDAIAATAHKLQADGATPDLYAPGTYNAVCAYIGSCSNVANCGGPNDYCQVLPRAQAWEKEGAAAVEAPVGPLEPITGDNVFPRVPHGSITTQFGAVDSLHSTPHKGLDLAGAGTIVAFHTGIVSVVQTTAQSGGYGNFVCVDHSDLGVTSCYAHMADGSVRVQFGQHVRAGEQLGTVGSTGFSTGPHLHFEIRRGAQVRICPAPYIGLTAIEACAQESVVGP